MATIKQKKVAKILVENGRKSVSAAMVEAGYSPNTAKAPSKLTESDGWAELMAQYLPDDKLAKKHEQLLEAKKVISANVFPDGKDGKPVNDFIEVDDNQAQGKALELAYKIKRRLDPKEGETKDFNIIIQHNVPRPE